MQGESLPLHLASMLGLVEVVLDRYGVEEINPGDMFLSNDQAREAVMLFTNANVQDGVFVYSGSAETSRSTAVTVRYNDETDSYKPKVEYLEDEASLREFGYKEKEVNE